ncbi:MAG TPA: AAA family ATPase [Candidatus Saccharimonadales bacterium]|nr:AAA family ATPase [Candidatus Saccharimonadales bacterium]
MKLIGIAGTDGSGKDTVGKMLAERHNWLFVSVTDILRDEARSRKLALTRKNLRKISEEWRRSDGPAVLVDKALEQYKQSSQSHKGLAIASLRHPAEARRVHELGGKVVWTDASPLIRYARISSRRRGSEDTVSYEEFLAEEKTQMKHAGDKHTLNLSGVNELADIVLDNEGSDIEAFKKEAEKALNLIVNS